MGRKQLKIGQTNLPLVPHLISIVIDLILWTLVLILSTGVLWTIIFGGTWAGYSWFLGVGVLATLFLIIRRRIKRQRLIAAGKTKQVELLDYGEDVNRFPWIRQVLPSIESLVWVSLAMYIVVVIWSYADIEAYNHNSYLFQKLAIAGGIFAVLMIGRLGWLWIARENKSDRE